MPRKNVRKRKEASDSKVDLKSLHYRKRKNSAKSETKKKPRTEGMETQSNLIEEDVSISESTASDLDRELGWKNGIHRIGMLYTLGSFFLTMKNKSEAYREGVKAAYDRLYQEFDGTRDDNSIEQLAFVIGQHDMAKSGSMTRKRPKDKKAHLYIHWDSYIKGAESYIPPFTKFDLEKNNVGVLFAFTTQSKIYEAGRNLAAEDCIHTEPEKTDETLTEIDSTPEFIQSYRETYQQFKRGYDEEKLGLRRGVVSRLIAAENNDAYFAGKKYAIVEFMQANHLTQRPDASYLGAFYGKKDANEFKVPLSGRLEAEFKEKYLAEYMAELEEMEKSGDTVQQKAVPLFRKYIQIFTKPISETFKKAMKIAKNRAYSDFNNGYPLKPDLEKLEKEDSLEMIYQLFYYLMVLKKGETPEEEAMARRGRKSAITIAAKGGRAKSEKEIEEMSKKKGVAFANSYQASFRNKQSKMSAEEVAYKSFYYKGKDKTQGLVMRAGSSFQPLKFDKKDPLYLLKQEAYLLGLLKGLETKNEKFDEARKSKLRRQFAKKLNSIYQNPARKIFPSIKQMQERIDTEIISRSVSESSVRVGKVSAFNGKKGLFAQRVIYPGEFFLEYVGEIKSKEEAENSHYAAELDGNRVKDGANGNEAKYANHSDNPNAQLVLIGDDVVMIEALELIEPENQIIINYGPNYPIENKIGLNPWDTDDSSAVVYENHSADYSSEAFYFEKDFSEELGLPARGPYLTPQLIRAMLERDDEAFDRAVKKEAVELPLLSIEGQNKLLVFSDLHFNYYCNALMLACFIGSITYVTKLLETGARGNVLQRNNNSLLHLVFYGRGTEEEKIKIALLLLENRVNPFIINNDGIWFLTLMEKTITSKQLKLTVLEKLDPNNALLYACYAKLNGVVGFLVEKGQGFNLSCLVEGRLYSDFRNEVVAFLKILSQNDKKLFEALFGYAMLHSYDDVSSAHTPAFFKPVAMDISENKLAQHFYGLTEEQFTSLYQFIHDKEIFNLYPVIEYDLEQIKFKFNTLVMSEAEYDESNSNSELEEGSDNDENSESEELDESDEDNNYLSMD